MTVRIGQVWQDTYNYGIGKFMENPPTITVTKMDDEYVFGKRSPSNRISRVRRLGDGIRGYRLLRDVEEP